MAKKDKLEVIRLDCDVTSFDMEVVLTRDGRERGLWIWLVDTLRDPPTEATVLLEWPKAQKFLEAFQKSLTTRKTGRAKKTIRSGSNGQRGRR